MHRHSRQGRALSEMGELESLAVELKVRRVREGPPTHDQWGVERLVYSKHSCPRQLSDVVSCSLFPFKKYH